MTKTIKAIKNKYTALVKTHNDLKDQYELSHNEAGVLGCQIALEHLTEIVSDLDKIEGLINEFN